MPLLERVMSTGAAAARAWRDFGAEPTIELDGRYADRWHWYAGTWRRDALVVGQRRTDPLLYKNTRQLWRTADAVVSLYEQFVYAGDLPNPPGAEDGDEAFRAAVAASAIPLDPQTGTPQGDTALLRAAAELWSLWRWRQHMALRPKFGAVLGDLLTEVVDDPAHGAVWPRMVWPGHVVDVDLNAVGDIKRYALQYRVDVAGSTAYGEAVAAESYVFRKEVDGRAFRYYKDGRPFAYPELGPAVQPNPYGFVPAAWDRHEIVFGDRGMGALDKTMATAGEINSLLSNALDYQQKQFNAPVGVKGAAATLNQARRRGGLGALLPNQTADPDAGDPATAGAAQSAARIAETMGLLPMGPDGEFVTVQFDVGRTVEMLSLVIDAVDAESPEARYGQRLLEMSQATGPAVELILAPIAGKVQRARANYDPQTVKLFQMGVSIVAYRLAAGAYDPRLVARRRSRYAAFAPFRLDSYDAGLLDCGVAGRAVFPESQADKVARLIQVQQLESPSLLRQAGLSGEDAEALVAERAQRQREAFEHRRRMFDAGAEPGEGEDGE